MGRHNPDLKYLTDADNSFRSGIAELPDPPRSQVPPDKLAGYGYEPEFVVDLKAWTCQAIALGFSEAWCQRVAGVNKSLLVRWRKADPEYAEAFAEAKRELAERMEQEGRRRAFVGYQPNPEKSEIKYSDRLLEVALKAEMPEKYSRESTGGGRIVLNIQQVESVQVEEGEIEDILGEFVEIKPKEIEAGSPDG